MKQILSRVKNELSLEMKTFVPWRFQKQTTALESSRKEIDQKSIKKIKDFKWPFYKISKFNTTFTNYLYSFRDDKSELFSKSNLMFVVGPEKTGKSWFIKYNLRFFDNHNQLDPKPLIMHWDLTKYNLLNFETFAANLESLLISAISNRCKQDIEKGKQLITTQQILEVFFARYDPTYVKYYLTKSLKAFINEEEHFLIEQDNLGIFYDTLDEINPKIYVEKDYLIEKFQALIDVLQSQFENNNVHAALMLLRSVNIAMELEQKPELYKNIYYRNGVETTDFLFDVINYFSGYHKLNHYTDMDPNDAKFKNLIHSSLIIENFDSILNNGYNDKRVKDYVDHIILRLYDDLRMRTHFPVIIETNQNRFFNRLMFDYLHEREDTSYPALELYGWMEEDQENALSHIFTVDQIKHARLYLGTHLKDWHDFVNVMLTDKNPDINKALSLQHPQFEKERRIFKNKLNKFFTHPLVADLLDQEVLDYLLLDFIEKTCSKLIEGLIYTGPPLAQTYILDNPVVQALMDVGILYERKYFSVLQLSRKTYIFYAVEYYKERMSQMSVLEKQKYKRYNKKHGMSRFMQELAYSQIYRDKYSFEEPKMDMRYEIKDYYPPGDPDTMMNSSGYHFILF